MPKKHRSEAQRRHDFLLHQSRFDPVTYRAASLEDVVETARQLRERLSAAEADAEGSKKALVSAQSQVIQLQGKLSTEESRNGELLQALNSEGKQLQKSTERCSELMNTASSLRRNVHRSEMRYHRAKETRCHAIEKAVDRARMEFESSETKTVKRPDGRIEDWVRHLVVELVALDGVPTAKVPQVIERVRRNFSPNGNVPGDQVGGNAKKQTISDRSVRRMLVESYVKAFLWAAELFNEAPSWTASGDSTSYRGVGIGSRFATFPPVLFARNVIGVTPGVPFHHFLASTREVNHKTSTQFENWLTTLDDIATIYNNSPSGRKNPITVDEIVQKLTGYTGDHASDQKRLGKELLCRKREAVVRSHGRKAVMSKPSEEVEEVMTTKFLEALSGVGGWEGWEKLPQGDQRQFLGRLVEDTHCHFGELDLAELPEPERRIELLFALSWCAMHKELNTFKAGAVYLARFWRENGLDGPVKLLSREQEELAATGGSEEGDGADQAAGGAVKLTSLIGALVNNKDEGKGYAEEFQTYAQDHLGGPVPLADTSNVRYQCYGDAAAEIIQHPDLYIDFINQHGMKKKGAVGPNHMESNILKGLQDPATMTEMAVLTLYHESVSKPYAMQVRGVINEHKNALDLGPLHCDLVAHINMLIDNPALLIGNAVSHETGAFYGTPWNQHAIDAALSRQENLPHLNRALIAFLKGARDKWPAFTEEFAPDSEIPQLTAEEKALAFRSPTNDHNEGSGAMCKQWSRRAPRMTTHQRNARIQVQLNKPGLLEFSRSLGDEDRAFTRHKAREIDAAKSPLKERKAQATADKEAVKEEQREAERLARKREEGKVKEREMVEGFEPILDLNKFRSLPPKQPNNLFLQRQLIWHREVDGDGDLPGGRFTNVNKEKMKELVEGALVRRNRVKDVDADTMMVDGKRSNCSQTGIDDQWPTDTSLTPDESEAELEYVDEVGLSLSHAKLGFPSKSSHKGPTTGHVHNLQASDVIDAEADAVMADGKRSNCSQTGINDQVPTDTSLTPDESEAELEHIDEVGLSLSHAKLGCSGKSSHKGPTTGHVHGPQASDPTPQIYDFGCRWDPVDYSCSYDCIFMAFAWVYFHATRLWRTTWTGDSAPAKTLSKHFKIILRALEGPVNNQPASQIPILFSRGRDALRDVLSGENPGMFRRHGPVDACLADILHSLSRGEKSSKYFSFISTCTGQKCTPKILTPAGAPFMLTSTNWASITHSENPPHHESLQEWVTRWFNQKGSHLPRACPGGCAEHSLTCSFLKPAWIWFEIFIEQPDVVLPSFELTFSTYSYRLAAALYGNGHHFIARLCTPSGTWWLYDGQENGGRPMVASIVGEEDLLRCGGYVLNALLYCQNS